MKHYILQHKKEVYEYTAAMIVMELLTVYSATLNADIINALIKGKLTLFLTKTVTLLIVWGFIVTITYWGAIFKEKAIQNIDISIRLDLVSTLSSKSYADYNSRSTGVYESWINNDIQLINDQGLSVFFSIIPAIFGTIFAILTLFSYHWSLAISSMILAALIILTPKVFDRIVSLSNRRLTSENEKFVKTTQDSLDHFNLLYTFKSLSYLTNSIFSSSSALKHAYVEREKSQSKILATGFMGNVISQVLLIGLSGFLAIRRIVTIGTLSATGSLSGNIFNNLGSLSNNLGMIRGVDPIFMKFENERKKTTQPKQRPIQDNDLEFTSISLIDVTYSYHKQQPTLQHINYQFNLNKKYLILGESGAGKTTLLRIIAGYYRDYQGKVFLGQYDLQDCRSSSINAKILYLDQKPQALNASIRKNLALTDTYTDEQLIRVLLKVKLIADKEDGASFLEKRAGQDGSNLSGGQLQRLALARGLLRHISIILLDEGTSSIDATNAIAIENMLLREPNLTLIMVSHTPHDNNKNQFDKVIHFDHLNHGH
ncbi:hypothetical protein DA798_08515 [Lactobacillus sp. PFC-70]|nr:hypothetical protein DA798_08515 [Lactobacillus sp. PFC-70]